MVTQFIVLNPQQLHRNMAKKQDPKNRHTFSTLPEFDKAMKKIVAVPKEDVEKREKESRTPRVQ